MKYILSTVYCQDFLNVIGGIESHLYYLCKKYQKRDLTVIYRQGSQEQIDRLRKYVRVIKAQPKDIYECETAFVTAGSNVINQIQAKEVYFVIHADYKSQIENGTMAKTAIEANSRYEHYLAVSNVARDGFTLEAEVVYMPIEIEKHEQPIMLISATRLTKEKGLKRMQALATALDNAKVNYLWHVYTNSTEHINSPNVYLFQPRLDITSKMELYDGMVQLSDSEAYSVTLNEALLLGIPLITTPLKVLTDDFKIDQRSYIELPFDMQNISAQVERIRHIKDMKANMPKYTTPKEKWGKYITKKKSTYKDNTMTVKCIKPYIDILLQRTIQPDEVFTVSEERGLYLIGKGLVKGE